MDTWSSFFSSERAARRRLGIEAATETLEKPAATSGGSMLVWARPGPRAEAQAQWTGMMARGLEVEVTLVDVIKLPDSLPLSEAKTAMEDQVESRMGTLCQRAHEGFGDTALDCRVRVAPGAAQNIVDLAVSGTYDDVVLWAPVEEWAIREVLLNTESAVFVVRCPRLRPELPWTAAVADGDEAALPVAKALVRGSEEEASLHVASSIDLEELDEIPGQVVCVSRPMPGWWSSRVFRRERSTSSERAIIEVYASSVVPPTGDKGG